MRLSELPKEYNAWRLRQLIEKVVELEIAPRVSYQTIRRTLKKQDNAAQGSILSYLSKSERQDCCTH